MIIGLDKAKVISGLDKSLSSGREELIRVENEGRESVHVRTGNVFEVFLLGGGRESRWLLEEWFCFNWEKL